MYRIAQSYRRSTSQEESGRTRNGPWSATDEARLRELAARALSGACIAQHLGRSVGSVMMKASRLGVAIGRQPSGSR